MCPRKFIPLRTKQYSAAHGTHFKTTDNLGLRREQSQACLNYAEAMVQIGEANRQRTTSKAVNWRTQQMSP